MCLGAIYWARPERFYFAATREDATAGGFDDALIYTELHLDPDKRTIPGYPVLREAGLQAFSEWNESPDRLTY
jgi:guanine deaminase